MARQWRIFSASMLLVALALASFALPASAASYSFSNAAAITITDRTGGTPAAANPYPSSITVANVAGAITKVTVTVTGLSHNTASDVDMLLRGPGGQAIMLLSDVGDDGNWSSDAITFDDAAAATYQTTSGNTNTNLPGGTYRPTNSSSGNAVCATDTQPAGSSAPSITTLAGFNGLSGASVNGDWSLFISDDCFFNGGGSISGGWSLSITTDVPVATNDSYSTGYRQTLTVAAPGVLGNDTNPLADTLSAVLETAPLSGTLALAADGSFTYTPNQGFTGDDSFTYRAANGVASSEPATVTISVASVPFAGDMALTIDEDTPFAGTLLGEDDNGEPLTFSIVTQPLSGTLELTDAVTGAFIYTPTAELSGADSFTFQTSDGTNSSSIATVSITVVAVNDAPVNSVPGAQGTPCNTPLVLSAAGGNALSVADVDAGGDLEVVLSVTGGTLTLSDTTGLTSVTGDGSASVSMLGPQAAINVALDGLTFTPSDGVGGDANLTMVTSDLGQTGAGGALSDSDTVVIAVGKLAQAISFTNPGPRTYGAAPLSLSATADSGLPVSFSVVSGPATVSGSTLTITGAGTVTVRASQAGNPTYGPTSVDQIFTVARAALTIRADDKAMVAGSALPALTATYTGFVNGDTAASLDTPVSLSTTATSASAAGDYPIVAAGAADSNYTITFANGTLRISAAAPTTYIIALPLLAR
jgi:hypothetical protein